MCGMHSWTQGQSVGSELLCRLTSYRSDTSILSVFRKVFYILTTLSQQVLKQNVNQTWNPLKRIGVKIEGNAAERKPWQQTLKSQYRSPWNQNWEKIGKKVYSPRSFKT